MSDRREVEGGEKIETGSVFDGILDASVLLWVWDSVEWVLVPGNDDCTKIGTKLKDRRFSIAVILFSSSVHLNDLSGEVDCSAGAGE